MKKGVESFESYEKAEQDVYRSKKALKDDPFFRVGYH